MKKGLLLLLTLLLLFSVHCASAEGTDLVFEKGSSLVVFDQGGVKFTLNGDVEDNGVFQISLQGVVENKNDFPIQVTFSGACNGWSLNTYVLGNGSKIAANSKAKVNIYFEYEAVEIKRFSDLEEALLTFCIYNLNNNETVQTIENVHLLFSGDSQVAMTYFEECPILPEPTFCGAMYCSHHRGMTRINGIASSNASYTYTSNLDLTDAFDEYIQQLRTMGFTVSGSGKTRSISQNGDKLATVTLDKNILIEILPGHEQSGANKGTQSGSGTATRIKKSMGDTLTTDTMKMTLSDKGVTSRIYSYIGAEPSYYFYIDAQNGNKLLYVKGTFKNAGTREVDIRNICTQVLIDGQYTYEGAVTALRPDGRNFENYVSAQSTVDYYIYFEIPSHIINNYKSAVLTLGFTDSFNTKVSQALKGYNFDICNDVFEIDLNAKGTTATTQTTVSASDRKTTTTSTPAASDTDNGRGVIMFQDIPWGSSPSEARKILYSKGYVSSQSPEPADYYGYAFGKLSDGNSPYYELSQYYEKVLYGDSMLSELKKNIAGYSVGNLTLTYTYGIKNGKLDKQTRKLISAYVELDAYDSTAAMSDLLTKLTKVYGEYDKKSYRSYIWYGEDGSMLLLFEYAYPSLLYSGNDNKALVQQMYAELGYQADADDLGGL